MPLLFFQERPLGPTIFRHNKEIARGVQYLWLRYGVLSTCQCTTACLRALTHAGKKWKSVSPSRQFQLSPSGIQWMDVSIDGYFSPHPNRWWTSSIRSRDLILSYVQNLSIGHMHSNPVRWPSLPAGNALSLRQTRQMNAQHDPRVFVICCSLSNGFTVDDPGQWRTKCSTPRTDSIKGS